MSMFGGFYCMYDVCVPSTSAVVRAVDAPTHGHQYSHWRLACDITTDWHALITCICQPKSTNDANE